MKIHYIILIYIGLALGLASCSDQEETFATTEFEPLDIYIDADSHIESTRVDYPVSNVSVSQFENGDRLGIFTFDSSNTAHTKAQGYKQNLCFQVDDGNKLKPSTGEININQKDAKISYLMFTFPYDRTKSNDVPTEAVSFMVRTNQNRGAYQQSDILWAYYAKPDNGELTVEMKHLMACIIIEIPTHGVGDRYVQAADTANFPKLLNVYNQVKADLRVVDSDTIPADTIPADKYTLVTTDNGVAVKPVVITPWLWKKASIGSVEPHYFRAVIPAQTLTAGEPLVQYLGQKLKLASTVSLEQGKYYTIKINETVLNSLTIEVLEPEEISNSVPEFIIPDNTSTTPTTP